MMSPRLEPGLSFGRNAAMDRIGQRDGLPIGGPSEMRRTSIRGLLATILILGACSPAPSPIATPPPSSVPSATIAPVGDTIRIHMAAGQGPFFANPLPTGVGPLSNANFQETRPYADPGTLVHLVSSALYKFDDHLVPVPDLAATACDIGADGLTFTCRLVDTTFHDGSPLTAEDVAFTYRLALAGACSFQVCFEDQPRTPAIQEHLQSVEVVDRLTVRFHLRDRWAPFVTSILPIVTIDSEKVVMGQYQAFMSAASTVSLAALSATVKQLRAVEPGDDPRCEQHLRSAEIAVRSVGLEPADPSIREHACDHLSDLVDQLQATIGARNLTGNEAIAAAYPLLPFNLRPVGTGPWMVTQSVPGKQFILEAFNGYHEGPPRTRRIVVDMSTPASGDIAQPIGTGAVDIQQLPEQIDSDTWATLRRKPDLQFVRYAMLGYLAIQFNLRAGRLFGDPALREALDRCIDRRDTVDAATGGLGVVIESDVAPSSWAYDNALQAPRRDPDAARRLIEGSGWRLGPDGVYVRKGRRLTAGLLVRDDFPDRVRFARLVADQARDCGMEISVSEKSFLDELSPMIQTWPHIAPGTRQPFDMYLGGWVIGTDPDDAESGWGSDRITNARHPFDFNYIGFKDPEVDRLLAEGLSTYSIQERAPIYRRIQEILAMKRPYIFAYAFGGKTALSKGVGSAAGELDLASPFWDWRLTDLVLRG
jgi:ABC-type transport system substrate-binding protein